MSTKKKGRTAPTSAATQSLSRAVAAMDAGDLAGAEKLLATCLKTQPKVPEVWVVKGMLARRHGRLDEAAIAYQQALSLDPRHPDALNNLGHLFGQQGHWDEAKTHFQRALEVRPGFPQFRRALADAHRRCGEWAAAEEVLRGLLADAPKDIDAQRMLGAVLEKKGDLAGAIEQFRAFLTLAPNEDVVRAHWASLLDQAGQMDAAIEAMETVLARQPDHLALMNNLGSIYVRQNRFLKAVEWYGKAAAGGLRECVFLKNYGLLLVHLRRPDEALPYLEDYLVEAPEDANVQTTVALLQAKMCRWDALAGFRERVLLPILKAAADPAAIADPPLPFPLLVLPAEITEAEQRVLAERFARYINSRVTPDRFGARHRSIPTDRPLRLGYLSADFHNHATAHLMLGVFKRHDRRRVEVFAYSLGPDDGTHYRQRIREGVDHFIDLFGTTDTAAADRIAADGVDVLIDLKGYTQSSRAEILAQRPAPIQAQYLGYPGTMGADFIDYFVTDRVVSPPETQKDFSERFAYLPHCYQVNDDEQPIAQPLPSRADCGLPAQGFVFCCFCGVQKLDPALFSLWLRLLKAVPDSVLWLIESLPEAMETLRRRAAEAGVDPQRLVFAKHLPKDQHLARHIHADLFLDTYYCNAHTTASDALWGGVPFITCPGETFARRVGASLLTAVGLPELIVPDMAAYEALALALARDPARLQALRARLPSLVKTSPLFATEALVRDFEAVIVQWAKEYNDAKFGFVESATPVPAPRPVEDVLSLLGRAWQDYQQGQRERARAGIDAVLQIDARNPTAWVLHGILAKSEGDLVEAEAAYKRAAEYQPGDADAWFNLGNLLRQQARHDEAVHALRKAHGARPSWAAPLQALADLLRDRKSFSDAIHFALRATLVAPEGVEPWITLGNVWFAQGDHEQALLAYGKGLECDKSNLGCLVNSALVLEKLERHALMAEMAQRAMALDPTHRQAHLLKGRAYRSMGQLALERQLYLAWLKVNPADDEVQQLVGDVYNAMAVKAMDQDRPLSAEDLMDQAVAYAPDNATFHFNRSLVMMHNGKYPQGFAEYEWRLKLTHIPPHPSRFPIWLGESLAGKTILLHNEQGFGDALQFARFAPVLVAQGAKVVLELQPELKALLGRLPWVSAVVSKGDSYPPGIEYKLSILSLPDRLKTGLDEVPPTPYLEADPERVAHWQARLGKAALRVGMVWAGSPTNATEHKRAPGLAVLRPLWNNPAVQFVLLQKGGGRKSLEGMDLPDNVIDLGEEIRDFSDTAAIMKTLDVMISSDTSTAHLAGALGVRLWVALFHGADWRWIERNGGSVWYPNSRLFRQPIAGAWAPVVESMQQALSDALALATDGGHV